MSLILYEMKLKKKENNKSDFVYKMASSMCYRSEYWFELFIDSRSFNFQFNQVHVRSKKKMSILICVCAYTNPSSLFAWTQKFRESKQYLWFFSRQLFSILYHNGIYAWSLDGLDKVNISVNKKSYLNITLLKDR